MPRGTAFAAAMRCGLLAIAIVAAAASPAHPVSFGAEVFGGFNTHTMQAWNDDLDAANAAGGRFPGLDHSLSPGGSARVWVTKGWLIRAGWESLSLESKDEASTRALSFDATCIQADAVWFLPRSSPPRWGLAFGLGRYSLHGTRENGGQVNAHLSGHTTGVHFQGLAEWPIHAGLAITGAVGYRMAAIADTRVDGQSPSPQLETDYSGFMVRLGLASDWRERKAALSE